MQKPGDVGGTNIEVTKELYKTKAPETKGVISDVPMGLTVEEI